MLDWFKKEKPFSGFAGFGGGSTGLAGAGGSNITLSVTGTATQTLDLSSQEFNHNTTGPYVVTVSGSGAVLVKAWGASGGGYAGPGAYTGAGGFATGVLPVSDGDVFVVVVGAGGGAAPTYGNPGYAPLPYGGGGGGGPYNAAGGGFSGMFYTPGDPGVSQPTARIIAGGGGGRYSGTNDAGAGGGTNGQNANSGGTGGTQSAGGTHGTAGSGTAGSPGGALYGGFGGFKAGGGGGGGYYGGGGADGGASDGSQTSGGGGSGYIHPSVTSSTLTTGNYGTAANSSDPDWGNAGAGVDTVATYPGPTVGPGNAGRVIIRLS